MNLPGTSLPSDDRPQARNTGIASGTQLQFLATVPPCRLAGVVRKAKVFGHAGACGFGLNDSLVIGWGLASLVEPVLRHPRVNRFMIDSFDLLVEIAITEMHRIGGEFVWLVRCMNVGRALRDRDADRR